MEEFTEEDRTDPDGTEQSSTRPFTRRVRDASAPSWQAAKARLARVGDDVRIEMRSTAYAAERYARAKPWRVASMAAAVALLAGCLIGATLSTTYWRRRLAR